MTGTLIMGKKRKCRQKTFVLNLCWRSQTIHDNAFKKDECLPAPDPEPNLDDWDYLEEAEYRNRDVL